MSALTERFDLAAPVMNAGMGHIAVPVLVAAAAEAGALGMLATSTLTPGAVRAAVHEVRERTARPFGANVTLAYPNAADIAEVLLDEQVAALNLSMGAAPELVARAHDRGISVMSSVTTLRHALRAERDGVDFVVATGHEAAGHGSPIATLVLVQRLVAVLTIPVLAAGGICNAGGLRSVFALGGVGVSLGTRFALSAESPLHPATTAALLAADVESTLVTDRLDGFPSRVLAQGRALAIAAGAATPGETFRAIREGKLDEGVVACGQIIGLIDEVLTCRQIVEELAHA